MGSINSILVHGANAAGVQKGVMGLISKNIANASTPGYSRERFDLAPMAWGLGAQIAEHTSLRDTTLQRSLLGASQSLGFQEGRAGVLELAEPMVNSLDGMGPSKALEDFFGALSEAAANPGGTSQREAVLSHARSLARAISDSAAGFEEARRGAESSAAQAIDRINSVTTEVAHLNGQIRAIQAAGDAAHELVDQRDQLLVQLGELADIEVIDSEGSVMVTLSGGQKLLDGDRASMLELSGGGPDALSVSLKHPNGTTQPAPPSMGGQLGGAIAARDETLRQALDQLDEMAHGVITSMNALHSGGFGLDGVSGRNLFEGPAGVSGAALSMAVSVDVDGHPENLGFAADPALAEGDNTVAVALLNVRDQKMGPNGRTPAGGLDLVMNTVSRALSEAKSLIEVEASRVADLSAIRASRSGVSMQEEMIALTEAQRAFEAASRVIKVADELYDDIMRLV